MERVALWDRRLAALIHAMDVFQPSVWFPESAEHEIAAVAFHGHLKDMHMLAKTFLSPAPQGFIRLVHCMPATSIEDFDSTLMLQLRHVSHLPTDPPPPWPSGGGDETGT